MRILRSLLFSRSSTLGLLSDLFLVGTAAARLAQKRTDPGGIKESPMDMMLAGGAAIRLLQRLLRRRRAKQITI